MDHVMPHVPVRQWVLTFPMPIRFLLAYRAPLRTEVLSAVLRVIQDRHRQALGEPGGDGGSVSVWQLAGSAMNLNPHLHALVLDGIFVWDDKRGTPVFRCAPPPRRREMPVLLDQMVAAVSGVLEQRGLLDEDPPPPDDDSAQLALVEAALTSRVATGERAGWSLERVRGAQPRDPEASRSRLHAFRDYYDLHAGVRIAAEDRPGLERLARYVARPPLSLKRLRVLSDGRLALELKRAWDDGTTAILFRPMELLERLAALVPHPRHHLVVYHGVLASRHRWRSWVVPPRPEGEEGSGRKGRRCRWIPWSKLLLRTFGVESERCPQCGTWMVARAVVRARPTIRHLLGVLGRPWEPEQRVPQPARSLPEPYLDGW